MQTFRRYAADNIKHSVHSWRPPNKNNGVKGQPA